MKEKRNENKNLNNFFTKKFWLGIKVTNFLFHFLTILIVN